MSKPTLEAIYREHFAFVWRVLKRLGVPDSDLPDAVQDVFIVVHKKLDEFDFASKVSTWLYAVSLRVASERRRRAHPRWESLDDADAEAAEPYDDVACGEPRALLDRALEAMSLEQRAVFTLFEIDGWSGERIAGTFGVPLATVHSRLRLARATFRQVVERSQKREAFELRRIGGKHG